MTTVWKVLGNPFVTCRYLIHRNWDNKCTYFKLLSFVVIYTYQQRAKTRVKDLGRQMRRLRAQKCNAWIEVGDVAIKHIKLKMKQ